MRLASHLAARLSRISVDASEGALGYHRGMIRFLLSTVFVSSFAVAQTPSIDSQVVFLYYKNVEEAAVFYEKTLGLAKTFDEGWVKIYRVGPDSSVGLVSEGEGVHRSSTDKPVMLSIVTSEVDAWARYLTRKGVPFRSELSDSKKVPVRGFIVEDPGGYTVEFFSWRK